MTNSTYEIVLIEWYDDHKNQCDDNSSGGTTRIQRSHVIMKFNWIHKLNTFDFVNLLNFHTRPHAYMCVCVCVGYMMYHMTDCRASTMQELVFIAIASHTLHFITSCDFKSMHTDLCVFFLFLNFEFHQFNFFGGFFLKFWYDEIFIEIIFYSIWIFMILILICHSLKNNEKKNRLKMCDDGKFLLREEEEENKYK